MNAARSKRMSGREFWINTSYDGRTKRKESNAIGRVYTQQHGYDSFKVIDYASFERLQSALEEIKTQNQKLLKRIEWYELKLADYAGNA